MKLDSKIESLNKSLDSVENRLDDNDDLNGNRIAKQNMIGRLKTINSLFDGVMSKLDGTSTLIKDKNINTFDHKVERIMENLIKAESFIYDGLVVDDDANYSSTYDPDLLNFRLNKLDSLFDDVYNYIDSDRISLADELLDDINYQSGITNKKLSSNTLISNDNSKLVTRAQDAVSSLDVIMDKVNDVAGYDAEIIKKRVDSILDAADKINRLIIKGEDNFERAIPEIRWITRTADNKIIYNVDVYMRTNTLKKFDENNLDEGKNVDFIKIGDMMMGDAKIDILNSYSLSSGNILIQNIPNELEEFLKDIFGDELYARLTGEDGEESLSGDDSGDEDENDDFDTGGDDDFDTGGDDGFDEFDGAEDDNFSEDEFEGDE